VTPNPGFKVTVQVEYLNNGAFLGTKLLKNTNRKPYTIYRMTSSDLWPRYQGHNIFWHWISQKQHEIEQ